MIDKLSQEGNKVGLKMNIVKTKIMGDGLAKQKELKVENHILEYIQEYFHPGQLFMEEPNNKK